jgi:CheY-like chemotaxis protein
MSEIGFASIFVVDDPFPGITGRLWEETSSESTQQIRRNVLVVDDERLVADTITEILENAGFHAVVAYDGWMALETAAKFRPDFLLTDVLMPRMNGVQLAIAIRKTYPAAKVLLFTGQAGVSEILLEGKKQGYEFDLIPKPIHPLKLIERLKEPQ